MEVKVSVNSITFSDNNTLFFNESDIVVFVGPNNAGKSASLKEINQKLQAKQHKSVVIKDISYDLPKDLPNFIHFLDRFTKKVSDSNAEIWYKGLGFSLRGLEIEYYWQNMSSHGLQAFHRIFVNLLSTEERITASNPPRNISLTTSAPEHPIHYLQRDDSVEKRFSEYFKQAFGQDLILHRNAGDQVPLHVGKKPLTEKGEDRVSFSYLQKLEKLPTLHTQGDGMRSFVGVLLNTFVSNHSVLLIDEPEAFLHPPQARLLGKMLSKDLPIGRQLFLSTHSEDFLKGLLDSNNSNLKIIRIQRKEDVNRVCMLDSEDIKNIWNDPLLRYSNVLNGLFHSKVIICEGDADCRFYNAIMDALYDRTDKVSPDILFIHCGGKHRIPTVVKSLKKLDVNISVIVDFDALNGIDPISSIYSELGGNWFEIENDWRIVKNSIDVQRPELETKDVKEDITKILSETDERILPKSVVSNINKLLKKTSAWSKAKEVGKSYIPRGDQTQAYDRLAKKLEEYNIFLVEIGELECFVKSIGNHGPAWVNEVLSKNLKEDLELEVARQFVAKIINE